MVSDRSRSGWQDQLLPYPPSQFGSTRTHEQLRAAMRSLAASQVTSHQAEAKIGGEEKKTTVIRKPNVNDFDNHSNLLLDCLELSHLFVFV